MKWISIALIFGAGFFTGYLSRSLLLTGGVEHVISTLEIILWPAVVLMIFFGYRQIFENLIYAINEFNFFGAKGKIRSVNEVIKTEVDEEIERILKTKDATKKMTALLEQTSRSQAENNELKEFIITQQKRILELEQGARLQSHHRETIDQLKQQIGSLLEIIASLQSQLCQSALKIYHLSAPKSFHRI